MTSSLLISLETGPHAESIRACLAHHDAWSTVWRSSLELAIEALHALSAPCELWLVEESLLNQDPVKWLERARRAAPELCVIVLRAQGDGSSRDRLTWLELGVYELIVWEELRAARRADRLVLLLEMLLGRALSASRLQHQRASRDQELRAIYRFIHALDGSLDERAFLSQVVAMLVAACHRGAAAYLELIHPDDLPPGLDPLFSESEVEGVSDSSEAIAEALSGATKSSPELSLATLQVVEQAATDRLLVCLGPQMHASWLELLERRHPVLFRRAPASGHFPGLEPLWHRFKRGGEVVFVPIYEGDRPRGALVVAELEPGLPTSLKLGSQGFEALGALIASSLESAQRLRQAHDAYQTLHRAQAQLIHAEKFAAVGHLAAQIAHEINNPASFVISNLSVLQEYAESARVGFEQGVALLPEALKPRLIELVERHDLSFIQQDLDPLLERSLAGMQRIHQIVRDLRTLSYDAGSDFGWIDVRALLESTLNLVRAEIKYRAELKTCYAETPPIFSDANKLSQIFLNLLVNASQALAGGDPARDVMRVGTLRLERAVLVFVQDSGVGIRPEVLAQIFEPFFTTKPRGEGSGLGLSISRDLARSLGGEIRVYSEPGQGARFELMLPLKSPAS